MTTCDTLFEGKLVLFQDASGYRFSIDAVLLAGLTRAKPGDRVLDLGAGCGVVSLILAFRGSGYRWWGMEIQPRLVELANRNVAANGFQGRVRMIEGDFREIHRFFRAGSFDLVVSNPPYRKLRAGRVNPNGQVAVARHEIRGSLHDVVVASKYVLADGGRLSVIYPASRLDHLLGETLRFGLRPKRLRMIHSRCREPGRLVHLECRKGGGEELTVEPPLIIYDAEGKYTEAVTRLYVL